MFNFKASIVLILLCIPTLHYYYYLQLHPDTKQQQMKIVDAYKPLRQHVCVLQVALMALASMMACGGTSPASTSGLRRRPCWRPASTTALAWWKVSSTWWRRTAQSATIKLWTAGRPYRPCSTPWTTAPPPRATDACMPLALWLGRTPWPSSATMQTPTAGPWSAVGSCLRGPSRRKRWPLKASSTSSGEKHDLLIHSSTTKIQFLGTCTLLKYFSCMLL